MKYPCKCELSKASLLLCPILAVLAYCLIDYFNIPAHCGISVSNINTELLGIWVDVVVATTVFAVTYLLIERWNVKRINNQSETARYLLKQIYEQCRKLIYYLEDTSTLDALVKRTDFNAYEGENGVSAKYARIPFEYEPTILHFVESGAISKGEIETYFNVKEEFTTAVSMSVVCFDHPEKYLLLHKNALSSIATALSDIDDKKEANIG